MRVTKIVVKNFGPFYKEHRVDFPNDGFGIHVIRGDNGQGKTSLQRAILWGLYGKVSDRNNKEIPLTSLLNRTACKESDFSLAVSIHFNHENKPWCITRKTEAGANKDALLSRNMQVFITRDSEPLNNAQLVIERMLPSEVSRFFLFDGEMLRDYEELLDQDSVNMKILKGSIERILGIPLLRLARNDLNQIMKDTDAEKGRLVKRLGGKDYDQLADEYNKVVQNIGKIEKTIKDIEGQITGNESAIGEMKRKQTDLRSVHDFAVERNDLDQKINSLQSKKETQEEKLKELNAKLYKTVLSPTAKNVIVQLDIKHQATMARYDSKQKLLGKAEAIEQAIKVGKCDRCETIIEGSKKQALETELRMIREEIVRLTDIPEPNLEFSEYKALLERIGGSLLGKQSYTDIYGNLHTIAYEKAKLESRRNELNEKLIDVDQEEPFRIESEIRLLSEEHGRLLQLKTDTQGDLKEAIEYKSELDQKMSRIDQEELKELTIRIERCKNISEVFDKSISAYTEARRRDVESQATDVFKRLRSKEDFARLMINSNFGLCIVTKNGTILDKSEWRSAGEEQVVALALIGALNKCSRVLAPVLMDTPFGRLDNKHTEKVLDFLPSMSEQVILLVTDREFTKADEALLQGKIASDFTVEHKGEKDGSHFFKTVNGGTA